MVGSRTGWAGIAMDLLTSVADRDCLSDRTARCRDCSNGSLSVGLRGGVEDTDGRL